MQWWYDYFKDVDSKDVDKLTSWMREDVTFCFANGPAVKGKATIQNYLTEFFKCFDTISHAHGKLVGNDEFACGEATVIYKLHNGREIPAFAATVIERRDGLISRLHAYVDLSQLFSALAQDPVVSEPVPLQRQA